MKNLFKIFLQIAVDGDSSDSEGSTIMESTDVTGDNTEGIDETSTDNTTEENSGIEIDGEFYTLDQIKEFRKGYLRQSDFTRKTQELARQREELKDALEVYEYLKQNPHLASRLVDDDSDGSKNFIPNKNPNIPKIIDDETRQLKSEIWAIKIDRDLERLKAKDPDLDEIAVLNIANENNITLDKAYAMWRGSNVEKLIQKELKKVTEKIKKNGEMTGTMMNPSDGKPDKTYGLTDVELEWARKLDMTPQEYAKYKTYKPN